MIALPGARCAQDLGILPILISSTQEATELSEDQRFCVAYLSLLWELIESTLRHLNNHMYQCIGPLLRLAVGISAEQKY